MANPESDGLLDAPQVEMPIVPAPVDCMPSVLAAGRAAPVVKVDYYGGTVWDICDMDLARTALADRRLSKDIALTPDWMRIPGALLSKQPRAEVARAMILSEGAEHARIRRMHAWIFSPRNTEKWTTCLHQLTENLLDGLAAEGAAEVNLVERYTYPLPVMFFCKMLGLPPEWCEELKRVIGDALYSPDQAVRAGGVSDLFGMVAGWVDDPSSLNEGVITSLLDAVDSDDGEAITVDEVVGWTFGMVIGSYEPPASLIGSAFMEALRRPADQRPGSDAEVEAWIEETLRLHPSAVHATWRFATEDLDIGGYFVPQGAPVQINIAAANRCPHKDDFAPNAPGDHLSFGRGRHYCPGASLARLQARIALSAFLSRFPNARLSDTAEVRWESSWLSRRISVLPVVLAGTGSPQSDHGRSAQRG